MKNSRLLYLYFWEQAFLSQFLRWSNFQMRPFLRRLYKILPVRPVLFRVCFCKDGHDAIVPSLGTKHLLRKMTSFWLSDSLCNLWPSLQQKKSFLFATLNTHISRLSHCSRKKCNPAFHIFHLRCNEVNSRSHTKKKKKTHKSVQHR